MDAGNTREAIPLVNAALAPTGYPVVPMFFFFVGAEVQAAPGYACLVAFIECSGIHIAFLSSHESDLRSFDECRCISQESVREVAGGLVN